MRKRWMFIVPIAILGMVIFAVIGGEIVLHLWNWLVPALFGGHEVTFWQALGLLALCRILFGGFGWHGSGRSNARRRIKERMEERCAHMTPEERERFREGMRARWGFVPPAGESKGE